MKRFQLQLMLAGTLRWWRAACFATLGCGLGGVSSTAQADYASTVAAFDPVGYWRLNDTVSTTDDAINSGTGGAALNGIYVSSPTHAVAGALVGSSATAVSLNGSQKVQIPWSAALNAGSAGQANPFAVEAWVKSNGAPGGNHVVVQSMRQPASGNTNDRSGWFLRETGADLVFGVGTPTGAPFYYYYTVAGVVSATNWQHIAVVYDGDGTPTIYLDGVAQSYVVTRQDGLAFGAGEQAAIRVLLNTDYPEIVGDRGFGGWGFTGEIDEVAIYPSALSESVVVAHYTNGNDAGRTTPYETLVGASHPVAYYRLNEAVFAPQAVNSGSLGSAADGTYSVGTFTKAAGPPSVPGLGAGNLACRFDGTGQISCGSDGALDLGPISIAAWIKADGLVQDMNVLAKGSSLWRLQIDGLSNHLKWVCPGGGVTGTIPVVDGLWHHVVAVAGASGSALYVDGTLDASDATPVLALTANTDPVTIGSQNVAASRWYGSLDEVALFGSELTQTDVVNLVLAAQPSGKDITSFGPGAVINGNAITWTVPYGADVMNLAPTYTVSPLATPDATYPSGSGRDFTTPQTYTITAPDLSTKVYTVTVVVGGGLLVNTYDNTYGAAYLAPITNLMAVTPSGTGIQFSNIGYGDYLALPYGDFLSLPGITSAEGIAVLWEGWFDVTRNGKGDYTFGTASDDGSVVYMDLNDDGDFSDPGELVVNNNQDHGTTVVTAPVALNMNSVHVLIGFYEGGGGESMTARFNKGSGLDWAALQPINGSSGHFFPYPLAPTKDITAFAIAPYGDATIVGNLITLTVTNSDPVTALAPTVTINGTSVSPASGTTQNFTDMVTYTVTASDGSTRQYYVTVSVSDLPVANGASVWLKADAINPHDTSQSRIFGSDSFVKQWLDQSSNNQHAVQAAAASQPKYQANDLNGLPSVKWDGTGKYLLGPSNTMMKTIFAVCKKDAEATGLDGLFCASLSQDSQNIRGNGTSWSAPGNGANEADFPNGGQVGVNGLSGYIHNGQWHVLLEVSASSPLFTYQLGQIAYDRFFNGRLAELIIYNRALSADELNAVGGYLADKYALSTTYPPPAPQAKLFAFGIPGWPGIIDQTAKTIALTVPFSTNLTNFAPTYTLSGGATCDKPSGSSQNFTSPVTYTVKSSDNAHTNMYTVTVTKKAAGSEKEMLSFGPGALISGTDIAWTLPFGTHVTALAPTYVISALATCSPASGAVVNFTNPVTYTVTAEDGSTKAYTVTVVFPPPPPTTTTPALWLDASQVSGLSDGQQVDTWADTSGRNNHAIRQSGSSTGYPQYVASGLNSQPVLRFNSANGNTGDYFRFNRINTIRTVFWVVKENAGLADGRFLLGDENSYHFHRQSANGPLWAGGTASPNVTNGMTKLMGTAVNGASTSLPADQFQVISVVTTGNVEANQITQDRIYHGSWQGDIAEILIYDKALTSAEEEEIGSYLATKYGLATAYPYTTPQATIFSFGVPGSAGVINGTDITLRVLYGTDLTNMAPAYTMSGGATCDKASGSPQNFTTPQTYSVTSADSAITTVYTVTVTVGELPVTDGLSVWLKADAINPDDPSQIRLAGGDSFVAQWQDQSGNNQHASQAAGASQPQYLAADINGLPSLKWDGSSKYLQGPSNTTMQTIFAVCKKDAEATGLDGLLCASPGQDSQNIRGNVDTWRAPGNGANEGDFPNGGRVDVNGASGFRHNGQWHILLEVSTSAPSFTYQLGQTAYNRFFNGRLAECIIYNRALTADEINTVGSYLANKYDLTTSYPELTPQAKMLSFGIPGWPGLIDQIDRSITLAVPYWTDVTTLAPAYTLSAGATCDKASGSSHDFSSPVVYTVRSADSAITNVFTVTVMVETVPFTETPMDVSATARGLEIQNDGTLVRAYHFGTSGAAATVNGVTFDDGGSPQNGDLNKDSAMTNWQGGWNGWVYTAPGDPAYNRLISSMIAATNTGSQITISGLTVGHAYRLQMLTNNPRSAPVTVEGALHTLSGGDMANPVLLTARWVAADDTLNVQWDTGMSQYSPHFNAYVLHDVTEVSLPDFDTWANSFPGFTDTAPGADPDRDGMSNQDEYAFGLNPTRGTSLNPITVRLNKATGKFSYTRRDPALTGLAYTVWTSTNLLTWTKDTVASAGQTVTATSGDVQTVGVTLSAAAVNGKLFVRVQAE